MIHPTAIVHPGAEVDPTTAVGPYAVIDPHVIIGPRCWIGPHVCLTGHTQIGADNRFHAGCVIGDAPQDLKYRDEPTRLQIGHGNVFREHVTVHRANSVAEDTVIGSENFFMAHSHVGHNAHLGNRVILANGALLAGHVNIADRAFISGNCLVHQFVRVGMLALMQGGAAVSKDLPPFTVARGDNHICGLNTIGLRRAGVPSGERLEIRTVYHALFRSGDRLQVALQNLNGKPLGDWARLLVEFVKGARRGVCADVSRTSASPGENGGSSAASLEDLPPDEP